MLEKAGKFIAKKALYTAMDFVFPGSKSILKAIDLLGPKATPENVETIADLMDNATGFATDTAENILDFLF